MTDEEFAVVVDAFVHKARSFDTATHTYWAETEDEWWRGIIGTAVADTLLLVDGTFTVEFLRAWAQS